MWVSGSALIGRRDWGGFGIKASPRDLLVASFVVSPSPTLVSYEVAMFGWQICTRGVDD